MVIRRRKRKTREKPTRLMGLKCVVRGNCHYDECYTDLDHVKTFGSGGSNEAHNLMPLCRKHHSEKHRVGVNAMAEKHAGFFEWLIDKGWKREAIGTGRKYHYIYKWIHPKEAQSCLRKKIL